MRLYDIHVHQIYRENELNLTENLLKTPEAELILDVLVFKLSVPGKHFIIYARLWSFYIIEHTICFILRSTQLSNKFLKQGSVVPCLKVI